MNRLLSCAALLLAATLGLNAQKPMQAPKGGKLISDELIGIFFEDISSSADGGLYAELIQNGSFEYSPAERDGWGCKIICINNCNFIIKILYKRFKKSNIRFMYNSINGFLFSFTKSFS